MSSSATIREKINQLRDLSHKDINLIAKVHLNSLTKLNFDSKNTKEVEAKLILNELLNRYNDLLKNQN